jgi:hypothetical protein
MELGIYPARLGAVASDQTLLNDPDWLGDILTGAIPATRIGVWINGNYAFSGVTPPIDSRQIVRALILATAVSQRSPRSASLIRRDGRFGDIATALACRTCSAGIVLDQASMVK